MLAGCQLITETTREFGEELTAVCGRETYVVNKIEDTRDGRCDTEDCSLYDAVATANFCSGLDGRARVVQLQEGAVYELTERDEEGADGHNALPSITETITVQGNGATIKRSATAFTFRIFHVAGGSPYRGRDDGFLRLENLTLRNGFAVVEGATTSWNSGGTIYNGGTLELSESQLVDNSARMFGGGIYNRGLGFGVDVPGRLTIEDSVIEGNRVFEGDGGGVHTAGEATIRRSTVARNTAMHGSGGGVLNGTRGTLLIRQSTFADNSAETRGGGLSNDGGATVESSTFSQNSAPGGAAILHGNRRTRMDLRDVTLAHNSARLFGGAALSSSGPIEITNSIVAENTSGDDCDVAEGLFAAVGENLDSDNTCFGFTLEADDAVLPLDDNGGPTRTHALADDSPAVDAGDRCLDTDQRGLPRPAGSACDIGAFERQEL